MRMLSDLPQDLKSMEEKRSRSSSLLASIENVDIKRIKPDEPDQVLESYGWHKPEKSITERKKQADSRREELLNLLYQDGINTGLAEELIKEWISLVVERDRLFREQVDKENTEEKAEYLCQLKQFLKDQPPLGDASEEVDIRDALLSLEKQVSQYCRSHQIASPPDPKVHFRSTRQGRPQSHRDSTRGSLHKSLHQQDLLDHETGQTGIPIIGDYSQSSVGSNVSRNILPIVENHYRSHVGHVTHPKATKLNSGEKERAQNSLNVHVAPSAAVCVSKSRDHPSHSFSKLTMPPLAPPPPPITPSSSLITVGTVHPRGGVRGVAGTVQFASSNLVCDFETHQTESINSGTNVITDGSDDRSSACTQAHPDPALECPSSGDRQNLMDEITSAGQSVLRRTSRPKSPGGTPMKVSRNRLTLTGNTDMLQRALINKFRSLHSTPIRQDEEKSGSLDLSNAWSDINSSCAVYDDPDLSSTPPSTLGPASQAAARETSNRSDIIVDPNSSTAV